MRSKIQFQIWKIMKFFLLTLFLKVLEWIMYPFLASVTVSFVNAIINIFLLWSLPLLWVLNIVYVNICQFTKLHKHMLSEIIHNNCILWILLNFFDIQGINSWKKYFNAFCWREVVLNIKFIAPPLMHFYYRNFFDS